MNHRSSENRGTQEELRLLVYGTLKRGYWNHDLFCRSATSIERAATFGQLYEMLSGIPVIKVADADVMAAGTADPIADVATQNRRAQDLDDIAAVSNCFHVVRGELVTLANPGLTLPPIDRLEGYSPGIRCSVYRRVLVPVEVAGRLTTAWLYASWGALPKGTKLLSAGVWESVHFIRT